MLFQDEVPSKLDLQYSAFKLSFWIFPSSVYGTQVLEQFSFPKLGCSTTNENF